MLYSIAVDVSPPGRVVRLHLKIGHKRPMRNVAEAVAVPEKGLMGDVSFGRSRRQLLLVDQADLDRHGLHPGDVRENITLAGVPLSGLPRGARLQIGSVVVEITGECTPCEMLDTLRPGLREEIRGRRGMLGRVVEGGTLREGDLAATFQLPAPDGSAAAPPAPGPADGPYFP
jgi:hypothetical protein